MQLTPVATIPESQLWTLEEPARSKIARGLAWAATHEPQETDLDELITRAFDAAEKREQAEKRAKDEKRASAGKRTRGRHK